MRTLISRGWVVDPLAGRDEMADILIRDGVVAAVSPAGAMCNEDTDEVMRAEGLWVTPELIDMHVHLREPGCEEAETVASGCRAAVAGGIAAVAAMANTEPANDCPAVTRHIRALGEEAGLARVMPVAAVTEGIEGKKLTCMEALKEAGACAFSDDGRPIGRADLMREALLASRALGLPVISHAEDPRLGPDGVMNAGEVARRLGMPGIPAEAEVAMVERDIELAAATGGRLHIAHVSTAGAIALIRQAKRNAIDVTAEVTPHHFTLTEEAVGEYGALAKMRPPLRTGQDVEAVREALADGTADAVASDHAPHTAEAKGRGLLEAPFGVIGLETMLPLTLALVREGVLTRPRAIELLSSGPARALRLPPPRLAPGAAATLTLIDPERAWRFDARRSFSLSRNSPFHGRRLIGRAVAVMIGGRAVLPLASEVA